jgi:hypothetical protein
VSDTEESEPGSESEQSTSALSDAPETESAESEAESTPPPAKKAVKARAKPVKKEPVKKKAKGGSKRVVDSDEDEDEDKKEDAASSPQSVKKQATPKKAKTPSKKAVEPDAEDSGIAPAPKQDVPEAKHGDDDKDTIMKEAPNDDASESEMSVLIDEPPTKKKRQKKDASEKASSKTSKASKPAKKAKEAPELSNDDAEIKRLQGWLVKCGIRKLWGKELKPFTTSKEKIRHLKDMLSDAGMEGRYSVEKARGVKERRELAADLEAVQEFGKRWGDEKSGRKAPRKRNVISDDEDDDDEEEDDAVESDDDPKKKMDQRVANWGIDADLLGSDGGEESD